MITLKIPYQTSEESTLLIQELRRQYSCVVRYAYNRAKEGKKQKEIRSLVKLLGNINLSSWFVQCAIMEGLTIHKRNKDKKVVFGGKISFRQRSKNKISDKELKEKRLFNLVLQGEGCRQGNRHFDFTKLINNKLIFKVNSKNHLELSFPILNKNYRKKLKFIQKVSELKEQPITISLSDKYIYFTYEEPKNYNVNTLLQNRYIGIDLNPNYIGVVVKSDETILHKQCFDLSDITQLIRNEANSSDSVRFKQLNNKLKHETLEISKTIESLALRFRCNFVFIEDLKSLSKANLDKGHALNRLTKNLWKRVYFVQNLEKRCKLNNIKLFKVNPMYSSVIGNVQYDYIDPINASLEIARRGYHVIILKDKAFYPSFTIKASLLNQWKEEGSEEVKDWKSCFKVVKNSKMRYRVSLEKVEKPFKVLKMKSIKSKVLIYEFQQS